MHDAKKPCGRRSGKARRAAVCENFQPRRAHTAGTNGCRSPLGETAQAPRAPGGRDHEGHQGSGEEKPEEEVNSPLRLSPFGWGTFRLSPHSVKTGERPV